MTEPPERDPRYEWVSVWNIDSLRALIGEQDRRYQDRWVAQELALRTALTEQKEALRTAMAASDKRLDGMNEFRQQLTEQAAMFMPRGEAGVALQALSDRVDGSITRNTDRITSLELLIRTMPNEQEHRSLKESNASAHATMGERISTLDRSVTERLALTAGRESGTQESTTNSRQVRAGAVQTAMVIMSGFSLFIAIVAIAITLVGQKP